ncbi:unnamed protein product [Rotaria socialis]|uniref:Uncharacterized protein n=1 Tax=Rotaria socialis TaxID=392032 RepID=A0A818CZ07_9BILA|nr:unnamed protein product [Rotaria socialis]CAF3439427.1 unnamed protein product [Rotaria socialis]CAF3566459.1 unnamed protein product [Rotaria socialis]CAF4267021.1 unnamed protein product [Rotaria socialis]CAF4403950.1 unnamed protein product [Rotaria socialis]
MKIIIFSILFTVQALDMERRFIPIDNSSIMNNLNAVTQTVNESDKTTFRETSNDLVTSRFHSDEIKFSTIFPEIISSDVSFENQTWSSSLVSDHWSFSSFSSMNDFDFTTLSQENKITKQEQWFNINQTHRQDPYRSILFWRRTNGSVGRDATYILTSEPQCIRQICSVELKYNGTLSLLNPISGCLSFFVRTRGLPVGQLWIREDHDQDNISQKFQLTNKNLRIEHSLKPKIKHLSIETRILFRNSQLDSLILSNLEVNWKGPCPKYRPNSTSSPDIIPRRSTLEDIFMTLTSEDSNSSSTLIPDEEFSNSQQNSIYESTTMIFNQETNRKSSFSLFSQKHIRWFLSLITFFCFLIVLCAVGHGLWLLRRQHHSVWHVTFDSKIQLVARRSIRSSTRSETKIATISQITYDILNDDSQKEQTDSLTTNSSRSTPISYYTYL